MDPIRILAVDDQISSLIALDDILTDLNARVIKATSAKEALLIMLKQSIDCILLDVSMPEMDGFEFLKTLRDGPAHAKIPVIMISGKIFSENEILKAYKFGAVDFLLKPLDPETVYRKVGFIVQQARRISAFRYLEEEIKGLEKDIIEPLEMLLIDEDISAQQKKILVAVTEKVKQLHATWWELK